MSTASLDFDAQPAPQVEPPQQVMRIAGWEQCPSGLITSGLRVLAEAAGADACGLVWIDGANVEAPDGLEVGPVSTPGERLSWIAAASKRGVTVAVDGDRLVAPVRAPDGRVSGAVVLVGDQSSAGVAAVGARHISQLLASSNVHMKRAAAYEALFEIGTQIQAEEANSEAIFALIVERAAELLDSDVAWLAMVDASGDHLRMRVAAGTTTPDFLRMEVRVGAGIGGIALKERRAVAVHDSSIYRNGMSRAIHRALDDEGVTSILCAPMLRDDGMLGALYVGTRAPRDFSEEDSSLLSALAAQAAITIENAKLYQ